MRHAIRTGCSVAILGIGLMSAASAEEPDIRYRSIFPPEPIHNHASCLVELANGDLMAAWYRGTGERRADDVQILAARLVRGEDAWRRRFVLADTPGYPDCNPALFAAPDRSLWLFYPTIIDHHWEGAVLKFATTKDSGPPEGPVPWQREGVLHVTPRRLPEQLTSAVEGLPPALKAFIPGSLIQETLGRSREEIYQRLGWMPRVRPLALPEGRWLLPLYTDTFSISLALYSDDQGASWLTSEPIIGFGAIQPAFVRRDDGTVVAYMRDNGPFHRIRQAESRDAGHTWSAVGSSELPNPGAGVDAIRLQNGQWLMIYNDTISDRNRLALALSRDEGRTWKLARYLEVSEPRAGRYHYPSLLQASDGTIHATYTRNRAGSSTIEHAAFSPAWLQEAGASLPREAIKEAGSTQ